MLAQLQRGTDRAQGVVLVRRGDAEHTHDGVADELLDRPAVALDHGAGIVEPACDDAAQRLGVEPFAELRRPCDVGEEDGDRSATYGHVRSVGLRFPAA